MYSGYFESTESSVILYDENKIIVDVNPSFLSIISMPREKVISCPLQDLFSEYQFDSNYRKWVEVYDTKTLKINLDDDINSKYFLKQTPLSKGGILEIFDVSKSIESLERDQLEQSMDLLVLLARGVSHDFNNHLMAISGSINLLILDSIDFTRAQQKYLFDAQRALFQATGLVKQFQYLSRDEAATQLKIDFYSIIKNIYSFLDRTSSKVVEKRINFISNMFFITADPVRLNQVFLNLINTLLNTLEDEAKEERRYIQISATVADRNIVSQNLKSEENYLHILIEDNFSKIGAELKNRLFLPFINENQDEVNMMKGLGLSIVYDFVTRQNNGSISVAGGEDNKTTIEMYLPGALQGENEITLEQEQTENLPKGEETILIADDEQVVRNVLTTILKQLGYRVHCVADGEQAVDFYRELADEIDLILLDITMPKLSGPEVLTHVLEINPKAKVIISSGHSSEEIHRGILSKAHGHLSKPYNRKELAELLREVLDEN